jgi:hypothetical protein
MVSGVSIIVVVGVVGVVPLSQSSNWCLLAPLIATPVLGGGVMFLASLLSCDTVMSVYIILTFLSVKN